MKVEIKLWVSRTDYDWHDKPIFSATSYKPSEDEETAIVGETTLEFEVPDDFNPVAHKVAALNAQLDKLADEYQQSRTKLLGKINDLLCLEAPQEVAQ